MSGIFLLIQKEVKIRFELLYLSLSLLIVSSVALVESQERTCSATISESNPHIDRSLTSGW